ncbi:MAG: NAD(+) synthase [Acutalibacteraceae bacterium]|jgi:NAD+ synthase
MARDWKTEYEKRVDFLKNALQTTGAKGFVFGNSGGKDSALVGILCHAACENTLGVVMPCSSSRNYGEDRDDGLALAKQFDISCVQVDLTPAKEALVQAITPAQAITDAAASNIAPRLRMTTLYAIAQSRGCLVAGTGNRSERFVGYYTKWGDGAFDINPIADLTATEIFDFLRYLQAPAHIVEKAPSAGLFEGQTDEGEMGFTYAALDRYILTGEGDPADVEKIESMHRRSAHKRVPPLTYGE